MSASTSEGVVSKLLARMEQLEMRLAVVEHELHQHRRAAQAPAQTPKRTRKPWTPEQREAQRQRLLAIRAREATRAPADR